MSYEPVTLGLKFAIRVHHLTGRDVVVVTCPHCHARFNVASHHFYAKYHEMRCLIDIEKDFKCRKCGSTQDLRWHIMRATGPQFPSVAFKRDKINQHLQLQTLSQPSPNEHLVAPIGRGRIYDSGCKSATRLEFVLGNIP